MGFQGEDPFSPIKLTWHCATLHLSEISATKHTLCMESNFMEISDILLQVLR